MGIELLYEDIAGGADGVSKKGTIVIAPDLEPAKRLLTLVHEAAHEKLHADADRRKETTKTIRESVSTIRLKYSSKGWSRKVQPTRMFSIVLRECPVDSELR